MLNKKILIPTILMSVLVFASASSPNNCSSEARFDVNKLAGYWNYLVQVSLYPVTSRCAHFFFKNEAEGEFSGYWFTMDEAKTINLTVIAHVANKTFQFAFKNSNGYNKPVSMQLVTCDGHSEFALEDESNGWYYIFSKGKTASEEILSKYQSLADDKDLQLTIINNDNCPDVNKAEHS